MADKIKLVQGDTGPQVRLTLTDEETGTATDLTGATVTMHFRAVGSSTVLFSRNAFINPDTATTGVCYIEWQSGDLSIDAGDYEGEIQVTRSTGVIETVYDIVKFKVRGEFA